MILLETEAERCYDGYKEKLETQAFLQGGTTVNDKQIAAFISVAECGSFSAAARKQYISPQAIIQQVDLLEREVGVQLLHRTHRGVTLTPSGKQFYQGMLRLTNEMSTLLEDIRSSNKMSLRIGVFDMSKMMDSLCESFSIHYPHITQEYMMVPPEAWMDALKLLHSGDLDVFEHVEVPDVYENGLDFMPLIRSKNVCAIHSTHPLSKKKVIEPQELSGLRIGIHDEACVPGLRAFLEKHAPHSILINGNMGPLSAFDICKDGGVFLMSEEFAQKFRPLRTIPFNCPLTSTYGVVFKKNPSPLVQLFLDNARLQYPQ